MVLLAGMNGVHVVYDNVFYFCYVSITCVLMFASIEKQCQSTVKKYVFGSIDDKQRIGDMVDYCSQA